jgi:hypothetical protein
VCFTNTPLYGDTSFPHTPLPWRRSKFTQQNMKIKIRTPSYFFMFGAKEKHKKKDKTV